MRHTVLTLFMLAGAPVFAQPCTPGWSDRFFSGSFDSPPTCLTTYSGPAGARLVAAGPFMFAGGAAAYSGSAAPFNSVTQWDGASWSPVGSGMNGSVAALAADGANLYAGGNFSTAGGASALYVAKWNGSTWSGLPGAALPRAVTAMTVFDDGTGPSLWCATGNGFPGSSYNVYRYTGTGWAQVGPNFAYYIWSLAGHDDGTGPALYAAGDFTSIGGAGRSLVAKWNGSAWLSVGSGLGPGASSTVYAIASFDADGPGPGPSHLYATGNFTTSGATSLLGLARWDGSAWSKVGTRDVTAGRSLRTADVAGGASLYIGTLASDATGTVYRWDGSALIAVSTTTSVGVTAMAGFQGSLAVGGTFTQSATATLPFNSLAAWNGSSWNSLSSTTFGNGLTGFSNAAFAFDEDGAGPLPATLFVSGPFTAVGNTVCYYVARWTGTQWLRADTGVRPGGAFSVNYAVLDDGSGPTLYAAGTVFLLPNTFARLVRWTGSGWVDVSNGLSGTVNSVVAFDDGGGEALYVLGSSLTAPGVAAAPVLRWRSGVWSAPGAIASSASARDAAAFDDGTGRALYVCGSESGAGGVFSRGIARWNGSQWSTPGLGLSTGTSNGSAYSLAVHDSGGNPALYVKGSFTTAGTVAASGFASWNGIWSAVPSCSCSADRMLSFDDGTGAALHAVSNDTPYLQRLRGASWEPLSGGIAFTTLGLATFDDDGSGPVPPALYIAGNVRLAGSNSSRGLARWGCPLPAPCYPNCDNSTTAPILNANDFGCFLNAFAAQDPYANCDNSTNPPTLNALDFSCFLSKFAAGCP